MTEKLSILDIWKNINQTKHFNTKLFIISRDMKSDEKVSKISDKIELLYM